MLSTSDDDIEFYKSVNTDPSRNNHNFSFATMRTQQLGCDGWVSAASLFVSL